MCHDPVKNQDYPCYQWFAAENNSVNSTQYGCTAASSLIKEIDINENEAPGYGGGYPCYDHNSLVTLLNSQSIGWKYYAQAGTLAKTQTSLWTAPNAIKGICVPTPSTQPGDTCTGHDWINYVESVFPNSTGYPNSFSPILTDLGADPAQQQCALPAVSWVVPDGTWSDHGGGDTNHGGPSWVSAIINAVGGYDNSGNKLLKQCGYWANTVILVTWDDWGGWYDHILPWRCQPGPGGTCQGYPGGPNSSDYVYGFRVPLLVVSAYAKQGYISGACQPGSCPNELQQYIHDVGSILNFIEYAFGTGGEISPNYHYADYFAPDGPVVCGTKCPLPYSLADFFDFTKQRTFTNFTAGLKPTQCFLTPTMRGCFANFTPTDPDADGVDQQD